MRAFNNFALALCIAGTFTMSNKSHAFDQATEFALSAYIACNRAYAMQAAYYDGTSKQWARHAADQCEPERTMLRKEYLRTYDEAMANRFDQTALETALKNNESLIEATRRH